MKSFSIWCVCALSYIKNVNQVCVGVYIYSFDQSLKVAYEHRSSLNAKHGMRPHGFTAGVTRSSSVELKTEVAMMQEVQGRVVLITFLECTIDFSRMKICYEIGFISRTSLIPIYKLLIKY